MKIDPAVAEIGDMFADRQTHTQTDRQTDRNTPLRYRGRIITAVTKRVTKFRIESNKLNNFRQNESESCTTLLMCGVDSTRQYCCEPCTDLGPKYSIVGLSYRVNAK